ncbi:MAG: hypothetical protein ACI8RZ_003998 [Myxococcota bacterium]
MPLQKTAGVLFEHPIRWSAFSAEPYKRVVSGSMTEAPGDTGCQQPPSVPGEGG